jgi:two-component system OmpR family sensor kinase/two-component system sensor histidine kinase BaeS
MIRAGVILSLVLALSVIGGSTVFTWITRGLSDQTRTSPGQVMIVALVVAWVIAFLAVARRSGPLGDLVSAAHRVADGDFDVRVAAHGPPILRKVSTAFNEMAERLARQERQRRELMADVAHELRTPLSVVQGRLEGIIDGVYPADRSQLEPLLDETRVLTRLVEDLRTLANAESGILTLDRERTDAGMLVRDAASAIADEAAKRGVTIAIDEEAGMAPADIDPVRMRQVVVNLLANAVRHSGSGATVTVGVRSTNGALEVRVSDTGAGIAPGDLARIFDRFYKGPGSSGSGLGLTIARSLVRAHGGEITAESRVGAGTTMTIAVPAVFSQETRSPGV